MEKWVDDGENQQYARALEVMHNTMTAGRTRNDMSVIINRVEKKLFVYIYPFGIYLFS